MCNFSTILSKCPPPPPSSLLKRVHEGSGGAAPGVGKVKVILRVANSGVIDERKTSFFKMDKKKKQVTLLAPDSLHRPATAEVDSAEEAAGAGAGDTQRRSLDVSAPKMFAFDGLYTDEDGQNELSAAALCDVVQVGLHQLILISPPPRPLQAVVGGTDGTLFCFGHANLGKSYTMVGSDESSRTVSGSNNTIQNCALTIQYTAGGRHPHGGLLAVQGHQGAAARGGGGARVGAGVRGGDQDGGRRRRGDARPARRLGSVQQSSLELFDFDIDTGCYQDVDVKIEEL